MLSLSFVQTGGPGSSDVRHKGYCSIVLVTSARSPRASGTNRGKEILRDANPFKEGDAQAGRCELEDEAQTLVPERDLCEISVRVLVRISLFPHKYII